MSTLPKKSGARKTNQKCRRREEYKEVPESRQITKESWTLNERNLKKMIFPENNRLNLKRQNQKINIPGPVRCKTGMIGSFVQNARELSNFFEAKRQAKRESKTNEAAIDR